MLEGAFIQPIATEDCLFVKATNLINHAHFGGYMCRGLVSGKYQIEGFSHRKQTRLLEHCLELPRWHVMTDTRYLSAARVGVAHQSQLDSEDRLL
jgi:hypothetical protein